MIDISVTEEGSKFNDNAFQAIMALLALRNAFSSPSPTNDENVIDVEYKIIEEE